ncbi:MAG: DUF1553 domain-containing protein [Lentisphaeraceae bacterium]|nr:DUF1553 domain-containing protein [Lentisphaeraceae bacterium]
MKHKRELCLTLTTYLSLGLFVSNLSAAEKKVDFNKQIRPILSQNCFDCHGPDEHSRKAKLRLDTKDGLLSQLDMQKAKLGDVDSSPLIERMITDDEDDLMPPSESHRTLESKDIALLRQWVREGAPFEEHWSYSKVENPKLPEVKNSDFIQNGIDHFSLAKLEERGLQPQKQASPEVLARRVSLLLTGLPPTLEELLDFTQDFTKRGQAAFADEIDRVLAKPSYGEHMAWTWMEASSYADSNGYQLDGMRDQYSWRDWLIKALNKNLPFDEFTKQVLAGDLMIKEKGKWESGHLFNDPETSDLVVASGFLRNGRYDTGSATVPAESKFENAADRLETVGSIWMGISFQCARCHDHKFDPLPAKDYYRMMSFFDDVSEFGSALKGNSHPYIYTPNTEQRQNLQKLDNKVNKIEAKLLEHQREIEQAEDDFLTASCPEMPRVTRGLKFHFAKDANLPKSTKGNVIVKDRNMGVSWKFDGNSQLKYGGEVSKVFDADGRWTVAVKFKFDEDKSMALFGSMKSKDSDRQGVQVEVVDGYLRVRQICRWSYSYIEFMSTEKLEKGQWYHMVFSSDGRRQGIAYKAWLNGSQDLMTMTHDMTSSRSDQFVETPFYIGELPHNNKLKGELADLRVYDRVLDEQEISLISSDQTLQQLSKTQRGLSLVKRHVFEECLSDDLSNLRQELVIAQEQRRKFILKLPSTMVMDHKDGVKTYLHPRGEYDNLAEEVFAGTPEVFSPMKNTGTNTRFELAEWLMSRENPLTSRVTANRLWTQLWGLGFVDTPGNFGTQCAEPEHRELLDHLAVKLMDLNWDLKAFYKYVMMSSTWQQSSKADESLYLQDPQNRLLGRGPRFRLPVSSVRDQILYIGNVLDKKMYGAPVAIDGIRVKDDKIRKDIPVVKNRKSIYAFWKRNTPHQIFATYDASDRTVCSVQVKRTNTPLQALITLNEATMFKAAENLARQTLSLELTEKEKVESLYERITIRKPDSYRVELLLSALNTYKKHYEEKSLQKNLSKNDVQKSAWSALANVIFNLDTTLCLE